MPVPTTHALFWIVGKSDKIAIAQHAPDNVIRIARPAQLHNAAIGNVLGTHRHIVGLISVVIEHIRKFAQATAILLHE